MRGPDPSRERLPIAGVLADFAGKLGAVRACAGVSCWITAPDLEPADPVIDQAGASSIQK